MARPALAVRYLPLAAADVREQVAYYDARAQGLGRRFLASLRDVEMLVQSHPEGLPEIEGGEIRAAVMRRFPFRVLYALRDDIVLIVAVAHTAREPHQFYGRV